MGHGLINSLRCKVKKKVPKKKLLIIIYIIYYINYIYYLLLIIIYIIYYIITFLWFFLLQLYINLTTHNILSILINRTIAKDNGNLPSEKLGHILNNT